MRFDYKTKSSSTGASVMEVLFGLGIGILVLSAVVGFSMFGSRSLAGLYADTSLDFQNRKTTDQLTKDLLSALEITSCSSNQFTVKDGDTNTLIYRYTNQTLYRIQGATTNALLADCTRLTFDYGMRLLSNGTFVVLRTANLSEIKTVTAQWCCARKFLGKSYDDMPQYVTVNMRSKQ